jgi:dimethylhistidine N-methyltransferase
MSPLQSPILQTTGQPKRRLQLLDFEPQPDDVRADVLSGLSKPVQKTLPCKLFYDLRGSQLFDRICDLPEYYPTRTELQILRDHAGVIADSILDPHGPDARSDASRDSRSGPDDVVLVEYGSGSSLKTRTLLRHLPGLRAYVPIDISRDHLLASAGKLSSLFEDIEIHPVCADYTQPFHLPAVAAGAGRVVAWFPGSTIGNFEPDDALAFLRSVRQTCGPGSGLLIGVDLKKDPHILHAAYNDSAGVTAAFNLNILRHINRALGSAFDLSTFAHYAFYNVPAGRMQMHLVSRLAQTIPLGAGARVTLAEGESIHTESCHKYTLDSFDALANAAGYTTTHTWLDPERLFSVHMLRADDRASPKSR